MSRIPNNIIHIVYDIYNSTTDYDERRKFFQDKYPEFVITYNKLFEMLCKPRFNFDKFIEITYNLSTNKKRKLRVLDEDTDPGQCLVCGKKRKRYSDGGDGDGSDADGDGYGNEGKGTEEDHNTLSANILLPKLEKLFTEQNNAVEYFV